MGDAALLIFLSTIRCHWPMMVETEEHERCPTQTQS